MGRRDRVYAVVAALLGGACASSEANGISDAREFPQAFAQRVCASLNRCCQHQSFEVDVPGCETAMRTSLERELSDYEGLKVRFDVSAAESCAAGWANVACLEQPSQDYDVKNNCERMFQGLVEPGGACVDSDECRTEGAQGAQCSNGACRLDPAPPNGGVQGEPCGSTCKNAGTGDRACEPAYAAYADPAADSTLPACFTSDGLHCAGTEGARTCQPLLAEGDSCAGSSQGCAANTFCDLDTRVCRAQTESGPCGPNGDGCTASATCNPETGQCVPTGNSTGARCQGDADCRSGYCNPFAVCQQRYSESFCAESQLD